MGKNNNDYENLYKEYKDLKYKTNPVAHDKIPGRKINAKYIKAKDIERLTQIEKELIEDYRDHLNFEDKTEIEKMLENSDY